MDQPSSRIPKVHVFRRHSATRRYFHLDLSPNASSEWEKMGRQAKTCDEMNSPKERGRVYVDFDGVDGIRFNGIDGKCFDGIDGRCFDGIDGRCWLEN